jgi:hypothetical protein
MEVRKHMRKRITMLIMAAMLALTMAFGGAGAALAAPDFGPGNSKKGPNDGGAKCHPPGQTVGAPGCKED